MSTKIIFWIGLINFWLVFGIVIGVSLYKNSYKQSEESILPEVQIKPTNEVTTTTGVIRKETAPKQRICWVIVDGKKYDVTVYRNEHSGGDIFVCGTDMSAVYHEQHGPKTILQMSGMIIP